MQSKLEHFLFFIRIYVKKKSNICLTFEYFDDLKMFERSRKNTRVLLASLYSDDVK